MYCERCEKEMDKNPIQRILYALCAACQLALAQIHRQEEGKKYPF